MIHIESNEQFHAAVAKDSLTVATFSAPWCGSCKQIRPSVEKLAEELSSQAAFIKLDGEELEELFEELDVDSFPHIRVYKNGEVIGEYTGSKVDKIDAFIRAKLQ